MPTIQFDDPSRLLVAPLPHFGRNDLRLAGGKGANLGELMRAGFDVPAGFVITTTAYELLLQQNDLQTRLAEMIGAPGNEQAAGQLSQEIWKLFEQLTIPEQITSAVVKAYHELGGSAAPQGRCAVAVRSSATAEDLPGAAFAGQQETFLNIIGEEALMRAVRACWASLWSERAILYRARQGVDQQTVKLAVVVQKMIAAEMAGVMFTVNPVSGARDELVIDASPGLGEAVVSGMVTPDHFVVNKRSQRIQEQSSGRREVVIRAKAGGGTEQVTAPDAPELASGQIRKLSRLGREIERHYGTPQDIEWAWIKDGRAAGHFFILQARPMTALPEPIQVSGPMRMVLPMLAEMWPTRPYPLDMTTFTGATERAIGGLLSAMMGKSAPNPDEALEEEDGVVVRFKPPQVRPSPGMLFAPWLTLWRTRRYDPLHWDADPLLSEYIKNAQALEQRDPASLSWEENLAALHEVLALIPRAMELRERYLPQTLLGLGILWLLLALARRTDRFGALVSGVRTKTTETNQALEDLATQIRSDPALRALFHGADVPELQNKLKASQQGQAFLKRFESFLDRYGHREATLTISEPAWKDRPEHVLAILKILAEAEPRQPESYAAWQKTRDELLSGSLLGTGLLHKAFLNALAKARALFQIREDTHFYLTLVQPAIRHVVLELGQRLAQAGALAQVEDVFHLRLEELESLGKRWPPPAETVAQIQELVARRKAKRASLANTPMLDPRLLGTSARTGADVLLQGTSGSPGVAQGPARIVHDISEFGKLQTGDVLVAPVTNPAWTPLFQRAAAVVVDTGGAASHAAIVAREYGVPAVMGTLRGTQELKDGQWIQVDGSRGLVLKGEKPT